MVSLFSMIVPILVLIKPSKVNVSSLWPCHRLCGVKPLLPRNLARREQHREGSRRLGQPTRETVGQNFPFFLCFIQYSIYSPDRCLLKADTTPQLPYSSSHSFLFLILFSIHAWMFTPCTRFLCTFSKCALFHCIKIQFIFR